MTDSTSKDPQAICDSAWGAVYSNTKWSQVSRIMADEERELVADAITRWDAERSKVEEDRRPVSQAQLRWWRWNIDEDKYNMLGRICRCEGVQKQINPSRWQPTGINKYICVDCNKIYYEVPQVTPGLRALEILTEAVVTASTYGRADFKLAPDSDVPVIQSEALRAKLRWVNGGRHLGKKGSPRRDAFDVFAKCAARLARLNLADSDQLLIAFQRIIDAKDAAVRAAILTEKSQS